MSTYLPYGDSKAMNQQAAAVFATHQQRRSTLGKLVGKMSPGTAGAKATIEQKSSRSMPIVQFMDLGKGKGDEIKFDLINPVGAYPIMGDNVAEGRGTALSGSQGSVRCNQARFPVDLGSGMTSIRSPFDFREMGRPIAKQLMDDYIDQSILVAAAGARGFHNNFDWKIPLAAHADFASIMVNTVKAPTKNRHFIVDGDQVKPVSLSGSDLAITTADILDLNVVDSIRSYMEQIVLPPPRVIFDNDQGADEDNLRVLLVSPAAFNSFVTDPLFRGFQSNAMARASKAGQHSIFSGQDVALWNGVLVVKMPKPIRFYAGDTIKYCASNSTETESDALVPAAFGTDFAIDRSILLGGQALCQVFAAHADSGMPFFWKEKKTDFDNKAELMIGAIRGIGKTRFNVNVGDGVMEYTDYGVTVFDHAVPIIGAGL